MDREQLTEYIRKHDPFFHDADFTRYSYYELMVIKVSIEVEKAQMNIPVEDKRIDYLND